jgi:MFS transporter, SP family, sugar:H+ symporter
MCFVLLTFTLGTLVGTVIDNGTKSIPSKQAYIIPLGIVYVIPGLVSIGLLFIPESPRWLLQMDREEDARKALKWLRPFPELVDAEFAEMKAAIDAEKLLAVNTEIIDIWRNPIDRRRTLLAVGAVTLQAASGAMYMICKNQPPNICVYHNLTSLQLTEHTSSKWLRSDLHL